MSCTVFRSKEIFQGPHHNH